MTDLRQRTPRARNPQYLAWLRKQSCACGCAKPAPSDAAHIRSGSIHYGKEYPGLQRKPDDSWCIPLARACHMRQHDYGELQFWEASGKDPFYLALTYNARYKLETGKDPTEDTARKRPAVAADTPAALRAPKRPRKPKNAPARPLAKRKAAWPAKGTRKLQSRKFRKE